MVRQLLSEADRLYHRAEAGVAALPVSARPGILAARHVYDGIGGEVRRAGFDSITARARTSRAQKARWLGRAMGQAVWIGVMPRSPVLYARPLAETAFLVAAAADPRPARHGWSEGLTEVFAQLAAHDRLDERGAWPS
jgi:phytoene synthase